MEFPVEMWMEHPGSKEPAFQAILRRKRNLNVVSFAALVHEFEGCCRNEAAVAQLRKSYQVARTLPATCLAKVFTHPSMTYWSKITQRLLPFLREGKPVPAQLTEHLRGIEGVEADPVTTHVADLSRFLIAAALLAKSEVSLLCPVHDGWLHLAGIGVRMACAERGIVQVTVKATPARALRIEDGAPVEVESILSECGERQEGLWCGDKLRALPAVRGSAGSMFIDPWDPYFSNVWHKLTFPDGVHVFDVKGEELGRWQVTLTESLGLLREVWPEMESEVSALVHTIVAVNSPGGRTNYSCSSDDFWGAILCSFDPPPILADVLVHEFGHIFLFELLEIHGIFAEDSPKEAVYYSPWRPEPRPLLGVLHAVYTFVHIAEYYRRMLRREPSNTSFRERYSLILGRLERGMHVLAESAKLNAAGVRFFELLDRGIRRLRESGEWLPLPAVESSLDEHLLTWKKKSPALRAPDFSATR
jgi:HEXXH motif-containing protein